MGCLHVLDSVFDAQNFKILMKSNLSIFFFSCLCVSYPILPDLRETKQMWQNIKEWFYPSKEYVELLSFILGTSL